MKETVHSFLVGALTRESSIYDWWYSEPLPIPFFDERKIPAVYNFDPQDDSTFVIDADSALASFLAKSSADREAISGPVLQICNDYMDLVGLKETIELYKSVENPESWMIRSIQKQGPLVEMKFPVEIWEFVHPQGVHLVRAMHHGETNMYVQILCDTDWDEEQGLQIVFKNGLQLVGLGPQEGDVLVEQEHP